MEIEEREILEKIPDDIYKKYIDKGVPAELLQKLVDLENAEMPMCDFEYETPKRLIWLHRFQWFSIFIHETLHWIFGLIFGWGFGRMYISPTNMDEMFAHVNWYYDFEKRSYFSQVAVSSAPIWAIPIAAALSFFVSPWFLIFLVYELINLEFATPSFGDIKHIMYYRIFKASEINGDEYYFNIFDALDHVSRYDLIFKTKLYSNLLAANKELFECEIRQHDNIL